VTVAEFNLRAIASARSEDKKSASPFPLPDAVRLIPDLEYAHPDGHSLLLDLYVPPQSSKPAPIVVWVHGGGWDMGDRHDRTAVPLSAFGYAVASTDYRLSQQATFPAQIEDCKAAVRWLRTHAREYNLDAAHIGAWGASAGGHLVALLGTSGDVKELEGAEGNLDESSRVQAVCDWFGPTDLTKIDTRAWYKALRINMRPFMQPDPSADHRGGGDSFESRLLGGAPSELKEKALRASPITYVSKDDPPFLIMHGDRDPMMPLAQSEILCDALKNAGVEVKLQVVPGAGHGFDGPEIMDAVRHFFAVHLKQ
jgi:acetyl esterase/lipase